MIGSYKNINELVVALEKQKKSNSNFKTDDKALFDECWMVFEKLKKLSDFDADNVEKVIKELKDLPIEIKELDLTEFENTDQKAESKALNQQELKELIEEYEKALSADKKEEIAQEIYKKSGSKNVEQFIRTQNEIATKNQKAAINPEIPVQKTFEDRDEWRGKENVKKTIDELVVEYKGAELGKKERIEKEIYVKTGEKEVEKYIKKSEEVVSRNKNELEKLEKSLREKVTENLVKISENQPEKIIKIIEEASLAEKFDKKKVEKEIKKEIKEAEKRETIVQRIEEVRAEIVVESKAEEIAQKTFEKLKTENIPVTQETLVELKENILESWKENTEVKIPEQIQNKEEGRVVVRETVKAAENFKKENLENVVNYRAQELRKEIASELRSNGISDEVLIEKYAETVNKLSNNPKLIIEEVNRGEVYDLVQSKNPDKNPGQIEQAIDEAQFMAKNIVMAPKKFNKIIGEYNRTRDLIGTEKLPKIREVRVVEKMTNLFAKNPQVLKLMNGAQRMAVFMERVNTIPGSLIAKIGVKDAGFKILGKIGGQTSVEFVKQASLVIAKEGTIQGIKSIAMGIMGKGAVVAGSGATGGVVASAVAAFQALPVVGQVVAVVVAGIMLVKPIVDGAKKVIGRTLNINMNGVKTFVSDTLGLGGFVGSVGQFVFDVGAFALSIPTLLLGLNLAAVITPVVIFFFLGMVLFSTLQQNQLSSLVPPPAVGGGNCVLKSVAENEGLINCDQNAPENSFPGISKSNFVRVAGQWHTGKNYSEECYNDTVNRALCDGVNPAYALWAWVHESGASNYSIEDVEDFGIHGQPSAPPKNYNAQINYFLTLDPGGACPELGYWLSFATNYLTGGCDPDQGNSVSGQTGRDYLRVMQETWSWVSSEPMPANISVSPGGQNCGSSGGESTETPISGEYTDEKGQVWICYGESGGSGGEIPDFEEWDPSIPVPEGCPSGRPTSGYFTQGPFAMGCSHQSMSIPAVDIGAGDGTSIVATHPGVAVQNYDSIYGYFIDVHGSCEGRDFYTRYAHMPEGGFRVGNNSEVRAGQEIGVVDNTGSSTGPHLHYHISGLDTNRFGQYLGLTVQETEQLWGCCGSWNGVLCP